MKNLKEENIEVLEAMNILAISFPNHIYLVLLIYPRYIWWVHFCTLKMFCTLSSINKK